MPALVRRKSDVTKIRSNIGAAGLALAVMLSGTPAAAQGRTQTQAQRQAQEDASTYVELEKFMEVYGRIKQNYVRNVSDHDLLKGAIDGMLASLDPHSAYAEGTDFDDLAMLATGNYGGLGLQSTIDNGVVRVIAPTEDGPAWKAGIKPGDYLIKIDGKLTYGDSMDQAVDRMRGTPGTKVDLTVVRQGRDKPFTVSVTRAVIATQPVKWEVKDGVGIVNLNRFTGQSGELVGKALADINKQTNGKVAGYILDLRSNGGGVVDEAVAIADLFLDRGEIVSQRGRDNQSIVRYYAKPGDVTNGKPVVVLVDAGSASASEIVAGALQDHRRGLVMGERSFGKGSVQSIYQLDSRRALSLTTELYYLPSGRSVQEGGIVPDILVPQLSDEDYATRDNVRESDLRRHLVAEGVDKTEFLEEDVLADPKFAMTAAELKKQGISDFQLDYSIRTIKRVESAAVKAPGTKA